MTKYINKTNEENKVKVKTTFSKIICDHGTTDHPGMDPEDFDYVILLRRKDNRAKHDLFVAYDEGEEGTDEFLYLGKAGDEFK